jgi:Na+-transporting NADH:ubiquinone oxidoreductase subunit NqrB
VTEQAALAAGHGLAVRGQTYPIVLPSVRDPRLHLAAVIISLQILGQFAFDFRLSIAQILISIGTCAVLELWIVLRRQHALVWPASALLTGNGVAFVLRVPGTEHGDWWSTQGWWIFAGTAAVALLSKYLVRFRGSHIFNPSNFGLVLCFLLLGPGRVEPLDFWWGPMSPALALALAIIVVGGFAILSRLALVGLAVSFWIVFAGVVAVVAATGHAITARWHLGPVEGLHLWTILAFSPEILVFLFFMLTDPRTVPAGSRQRLRFGVAVALVAVLLVAASSTEFWAKVGVLGALTIVCAVRPLAVVVTSSIRPSRLVLAALMIAVAAGYVGALVAAGSTTRATTASTVRPTTQPTKVPRIVIRPSKGVDSTLDRPSAVQIATDLQRRRPAMTLRRVTVWLEARRGQFPAVLAILESPSSRQFVEVAPRLDGYRIVRTLERR